MKINFNVSADTLNAFHEARINHSVVNYYLLTGEIDPEISGFLLNSATGSGAIELTLPEENEEWALLIACTQLAELVDSISALHLSIEEVRTKINESSELSLLEWGIKE